MKRRVLIVTGGMSPAIVTETVWALAKERAFWPDRVFVVVTAGAMERCRSSLLGAAGKLALLSRELGRPSLGVHLRRDRRVQRGRGVRRACRLPLADRAVGPGAPPASEPDRAGQVAEHQVSLGGAACGRGDAQAQRRCGPVRDQDGNLGVATRRRLDAAAGRAAAVLAVDRGSNVTRRSKRS